jgi:hypothetical protein
MAHNSFCEFLDGQFYNVVLDINPHSKNINGGEKEEEEWEEEDENEEEGEEGEEVMEGGRKKNKTKEIQRKKRERGNHILMQTAPCYIWSGTDFFITSAGIMGTETTIGGFNRYKISSPISCRIREAMQYGHNLDDYIEILKKDNSGDYANTWLLGDIRTKEIMAIELGLKYIDVKRSKNGFFIGCNVAFHPQIRNLECSDTGYCDIRRHQGARQVRLPDLLNKHQGKINTEIAKEIISDHYDVYLQKENPCSRSVCSHYELDAREYMSDPSRPKPFAPRGAIDGAVCSSEMARNMQFEMRYGNSCGTSFRVNDFCERHPQWQNMEPYLQDRPSQPWTVFSTMK